MNFCLRFFALSAPFCVDKRKLNCDNGQKNRVCLWRKKMTNKDILSRFEGDNIKRRYSGGGVESYTPAIRADYMKRLYPTELGHGNDRELRGKYAEALNMDKVLNSGKIVASKSRGASGR